MRGGRRPDPGFWAGRRVLLTGQTGFKGAWLALWLKRLGAELSAFALPPAPGPSMFELARVEGDCASRFVDLREAGAVRSAVEEARPEIVLHLAAQALVRRSIADPIETFESNVTGTANLLEAIRAQDGVAAALIVTSDKVYWNDGSGRPLPEDAPLGGKDPYSASKAAAEQVARAYAETYLERRGTRLATARGGNVIGGGDFAIDRIAPDCLRAALAGDPVVLRHPEATRPWQHALDCLCGYLLYAEDLTQNEDCPRALNIGPRSTEDLPVRVFAEILLGELGHVGRDGRPVIRVEPVPGSVEAPRLQIDASAARARLRWDDALVGRDAIAQTAAWYRRWRDREDMRASTLAEIEAYQG